MSRDNEIRDQMDLKHGDNDIRIRAYVDGDLSLSADGSQHFIYLYPHQVKLLKAFLADLEAS